MKGLTYYAVIALTATLLRDSYADDVQDLAKAYLNNTLQQERVIDYYNGNVSEQLRDRAIANYLNQQTVINNYNSGLWMHPEIERMIQLPNVVQRGFDNSQIYRRKY